MWLLFLAVLTALVVAPPISWAQSADESFPANAHARNYGSGWECDKSYRAVGDKCVAVVVPDNAFPTNRSFGSGWACRHGYNEVQQSSCVPVTVPEGGYLAASGEHWKCLRGWVKSGETCSPVIVPDNAYLADDSYGPAWICERGYTAEGKVCVKIRVPEHAYLNTATYGLPWTCERGFFEDDGQCTAVRVPANGYFHEAAYGAGWKCSRGYSKSDRDCIAIVLPENAHLARSGNRWECDKNFRQIRQRCVPES